MDGFVLGADAKTCCRLCVCLGLVEINSSLYNRVGTQIEAGIQSQQSFHHEYVGDPKTAVQHFCSHPVLSGAAILTSTEFPLFFKRGGLNLRFELCHKSTGLM